VAELFSSNFDPMVMASYKVLNGEGPSIHYWMNLWKRKGTTASLRGNHFHAAREADGKQIDNEIPTETGSIIRCMDYTTLPDGLYTECVVWSQRFMLVGRIDRLYIRTTHRGRYAFIEDWKTNAAIAKEGFRNKTMAYPLHQIPDSKWGHYTIQQNLYMFCLIEMGFQFGDITLLHVPDSHLNPNSTPQVIPIPNIQPTIQEMLTFIKNKDERHDREKLQSGYN
jgi:hypothetical protein